MDNPDDLTQSPPHSFQAEQSLIGAVLLRPTAIAQLTHLRAEDFYVPRLRAIWRAMSDLWSRNVPIDPTSVDVRLQAPDLASSGASVADLLDINLTVPVVSNAAVYAKFVADAATQRRLIGAASKISEAAWRQGADVDELMRLAEKCLNAARPERMSRDLVSPADWAEQFVVDLQRRASGERTAVSTGFIGLDRLTLGLESGGLYVLMANSGHGKTEVAMQIAMHVGKMHGPVVFASLEMERNELGHRFARISHGLDRNHMATGNLTDDEWALVAEAANEMAQSHFWPVVSRTSYTTADLRADCIEVQSQEGHLGLIVADYLQLFADGDQDPAHAEQNIGLVARNLKSLAREFGCPVLAPVQPNRQNSNSLSDQRLKAHHARGSGQIEQTADVIMAIHREEKFNPQTTEKGIAEVSMLKNRSGTGVDTGIARLVWTGSKYGDLKSDLPWSEAA